VTANTSRTVFKWFWGHNYGARKFWGFERRLLRSLVVQGIISCIPLVRSIPLQVSAGHHRSPGRMISEKTSGFLWVTIFEVFCIDIHSPNWLLSFANEIIIMHSKIHGSPAQVIVVSLCRSLSTTSFLFRNAKSKLWFSGNTKIPRIVQRLDDITYGTREFPLLYPKPPTWAAHMPSRL